ncbi:alpha/beta-hydrolase [Anaeromyces robustus]|uniref:Alpha/beta-hydrolase n=1 Tax=Anaeromyces robustus TaxID=1754192 RepID=A0A1Y1XHS1_9FUNG|nr:alpha/beta-hydrolase [Anaeromyces robustus]|eukprot:ORX85321.1 alpha/beta-hydrolase [Anaeromyces robustus]
MNHTEFYANNRKISLYIWENQNLTRPIGIIHIIHDFFDHASRYDEYAQFLIRNGFVVVAHDLNGHGYTTSLPSNNKVDTSILNTVNSYGSSNGYIPNENPTLQAYYPQNFNLRKNSNSAKTPFSQNYNSKSLNDGPINRSLSSSSLEKDTKPFNDKISMPTTSYILPESTTTTSISSIPNASEINSNEELNSSPFNNNNNNNNNNINKLKQYNSDDNELPPYSSVFNRLGYEEGDMFQNDIADIIAIFSYCRERYLHLPLILLGVGYGSLLAQYFIEHNKYRKYSNQRPLNYPYLYQNRSHNNDYHHHHHHHSSKKNKKKHNKSYRDNDSFMRHSSLIDPTIDGFVLCGTNFMKGLLFRTNEVYANLLYYIKGKNYRTNFLFPSIFQAYKFQSESENFDSDTDSSSSSYDSFIKSPNDDMNHKEHLSIPQITFSSSEIKKEKPINQWYTRNYYELTKIQQDPLCNFCYSINFYRSLLNGTSKFYKKRNAKAINTRIPILIIAGDHDPLGNYSKGPVKLYNFYKDYNVNNVKLFIYENARHSVLFENNKVEIYHDILKWTNNYVLPKY